MRKQIMQQINENLYSMEATGKVDPSILKLLDNLRELIKELKQKWLENRNTDSFYFYQGLRNIELMLDKMQDRFEHSQERHDNPKIAEDSIILFKDVDDLLAITESDKVDPNSVDRILSITRDLRNTASKQDLIEPIQVDEESLDRENIKYNFSSMMKNLDIPKDEVHEMTLEGQSEDNN